VELLDRYLYEVRRYLPPAQQDDIIAELSDTIQSHIEERERETGRALTSDETATILKAFGHPKIVASRYQPAQYLIGPEIYPFYWYTLKIALAAVLGLELLGALIAALLNPAPLPAFIKNIFVVWPSIFLVLGVVTFIFVALERTGSSASVLTKLGIDKWNPRALPRRTYGEVPRFSLLFEAFANILFMLWLLNFLPLHSAVGFIMNASGGGKTLAELAPLALTPNWQPLLWFAFTAAVLIVLQDFVLLLDPARTKLRAATLLVTNILMVIGVCMTLSAGSLVVLTHASTTAYAIAARALDQIAFTSLDMFEVATLVVAGIYIRPLLLRAPKADLNSSHYTWPR